MADIFVSECYEKKKNLDAKIQIRIQLCINKHVDKHAKYKYLVSKNQLLKGIENHQTLIIFNKNTFWLVVRTAIDKKR